MGNKSQELADADLAWLKGTSRDAAPASLFLAVETTLGTAATAGTEVSATDYERFEIDTSTDWSVIAHSADLDYSYLTNADDWDFVLPTEDWEELVSWSIYNDATAGMRLYYGELNPHQFIQTGVRFRIPAGTLEIREA